MHGKACPAEADKPAGRHGGHQLVPRRDGGRRERGVGRVLPVAADNDGLLVLAVGKQHAVELFDGAADACVDVGADKAGRAADQRTDIDLLPLFDDGQRRRADVHGQWDGDRFAGRQRHRFTFRRVFAVVKPDAPYRPRFPIFPHEISPFCRRPAAGAVPPAVGSPRLRAAFHCR